jgi:hypothetical protein
MQISFFEHRHTAISIFCMWAAEILTDRGTHNQWPESAPPTFVGYAIRYLRPFKARSVGERQQCILAFAGKIDS